MGFYFRKSLNFGPLRLNLSRSGFGASFGVKGARLGVSPRGHRYIQMGRGGLYYRQTLRSPTTSPHSYQPPISPAASEPIERIQSAAASQITDSSAAELLQELNRVRKRWDRFPWALGGGVLLLFLMFLNEASVLIFGLAATAIMVLVLWARNSDILNGTTVLTYQMETEASGEYSRIQTAFRYLSSCERIWSLDASAHNADVKYHAGAATSFARTLSTPRLARPPKVQCNLEVPCIKAGKTSLYFFPDRLLVYDSNEVGAVSYQALEMDSTVMRFVESERVPRDAEKIGTTWQYVNKKGGPDRRFRNNREFPLMQYGLLALVRSSGLKALFMCSSPGATAGFCASFPKPLAQETSHAPASTHTREQSAGESLGH